MDDSIKKAVQQAVDKWTIDNPWDAPKRPIAINYETSWRTMEAAERMADCLQWIGGSLDAIVDLLKDATEAIERMDLRHTRTIDADNRIADALERIAPDESEAADDETRPP